MRKVSFGIKRNTGTAGLWLVLMFSLTFLFGLVFKIQRHDKSGVFGQSAGFSSSDHLDGAFSVFSLNAWVLGAGGPRRLARRVWPGDSHLWDIFPVLCFVAKEDISATSAKCPDLQCSSFPRQTDFSPLRTFSYFEEQSVTLWVSPFPPSRKWTSRRCWPRPHSECWRVSKRVNSQWRVAVQNPGRAFDWSGKKQNEWPSRHLKCKSCFLAQQPLERSSVAAALRYVDTVPWNICGYSLSLAGGRSCCPSGQSRGRRPGIVRVAVWGHSKCRTLLRFSESCTIFRQVSSLRELNFHHSCFAIFWIDSTDARFLSPGKKIIR